MLTSTRRSGTDTKNVRPFVRRAQQNGGDRYETKPPDYTPKTGGAGMRRIHILTPRAGSHRNRPGAGFSLIQPAATAIAEAARRSEIADYVGIKGQKSKKALPVKRAPRKSAGERQPLNIERGSVRKNAGKRNGGRVRNRKRERAASRRTAPDRTAPTATANPNTAPEAAKVPRATGRK